LLIRLRCRRESSTAVASLNIEGIQAFKEDELLGVVASTPGQPYSEFNVAPTGTTFWPLYFNDGFPEARFTATAEKVTGSARRRGEQTCKKTGKTDKSE